LTTASAELPFDSGPAFSPDGRWLAFIRILTGNSSEIWVRNSNGDLNHVTSERGAISSVAWMDNHRIVYAAGAGPGQTQRGIRIVERGSGKPPVNPGFSESASAVSVARNGNLV
jgi:hypothetical protein